MKQSQERKVVADYCYIISMITFRCIFLEGAACLSTQIKLNSCSLNGIQPPRWSLIFSNFKSFYRDYFFGPKVVPKETVCKLSVEIGLKQDRCFFFFFCKKQNKINFHSNSSLVTVRITWSVYLLAFVCKALGLVNCSTAQTAEHSSRRPRTLCSSCSTEDGTKDRPTCTSLRTGAAVLWLTSVRTCTTRCILM